MFSTLIIFIHVTGLLSAAHAVMNTRTEQGAIAWGVSLAAFPYAALPAYWILGRSKFEGYVDARRLTEDLGADLLAEVRQRFLPSSSAK